MKPIHLNASDLPGHLLTGHIKNYQVILTETVTIPADAGTWSGGSRTLYSAVELATGRTLPLTDTFSAPWDASRAERTVTLRPGFAVLKSSMFCGKPMPPVYNIHPTDAWPALAAPPVELTPAEFDVLDVIASIKSTYRQEEYAHRRLTSSQVSNAKLNLTKLGLINAAGAITTAGRNRRNHGKS